MSGFFKRANTEDVVRYETPDGEDWIEMRADFSKGEVNKFAVAFPTEEKDRQGQLTFVERFAEVAVVRWSMLDERGQEVGFSVTEYRRLNSEAGQWVETTLLEHMQRTLGKQGDEAEGKPSS